MMPAITALLTTIRRIAYGYGTVQQSRPLTELPVDVLLNILDELDQRSLSALSRTCTDLHVLVRPNLLAHVELSSYTALYALVSTLETVPQLGGLVKSFVESREKPFLFLETQGPNPPPHLLTRLLTLTPRLRSLRISSPVEIDAPELAKALGGLKELREVEFGDATLKTVELLASIHDEAPLAALRVHCWPAALPASTRPPAALSASLSACITRHASTLKTLEVDAALLESLPHHHHVKLEAHGSACGDVKCASRCTSPCTWCAPIGAAWGSSRNSMSVSSRAARGVKAPRRPFSVVRWLASHVAALF